MKEGHTMKKLLSILTAAALFSCAFPAFAVEERLPELSVCWVEGMNPSMGLSPRSDGYVNVYEDVGKQDYRWGLMDAEGNLLVEPVFPYVVNPDGSPYTETVEPDQPEAHRFFDEATGKVGYRDRMTSEIVLEPIYDDGAVTISEGLVDVTLDGQRMVVDTAGEVRFTHDYVTIWSFSEGLAMVENRDGRIGFVDSTGKEAVPCTLRGIAYEFCGGLTTLHEDATGRQGILKNPLRAGTVSAWAEEEVEEARAAGLVTERTGSYMTYHITRLQFAELAANLVEQATGTALTAAEEGRFTDTDDIWARKAAQAGIVNGVGDGSSFAPNQLITREQLAVMLYRAVKCISAVEQDGALAPETAADLSAYNDSGSISQWAAQPMSVLVEMGILQGSDGNLMPQENTTVEQAVLLILRSAQYESSRD